MILSTTASLRRWQNSKSKAARQVYNLPRLNSLSFKTTMHLASSWAMSLSARKNVSYLFVPIGLSLKIDCYLVAFLQTDDTSAQKAAGNVVGNGTLSEEIAEAIRELAIGNNEGNATLSTELEQGLRNLTLSDNEGMFPFCSSLF